MKTYILPIFECLLCPQWKYKWPNVYEYTRWLQQRLVPFHHLVYTNERCSYRWSGLQRQSSRSDCWFENILWTRFNFWLPKSRHFDTHKCPLGQPKLSLYMWGLVSWQSADRPFPEKSLADNNSLFYDWVWLKVALGSVMRVKTFCGPHLRKPNFDW